MGTEFKNIIFKNSSGIAKIVIDHPPVNILNIATMKEINESLKTVHNDATVKLLVISGKGKTFSGGVDVKEHMGETCKEMISVFHGMFRLLAALPQPTLAVVNGATLGGGCELATFCDMVIASESAKLGQPEIRVGVFPPIAAIMFPRLIGRKKALELMLTGNVIDAHEALRLGLVNQVVPDEKLEEASNKMIQKLASLSNVVLRLTKRATFQGLDTDFEDVLQKVEDVYNNELMPTEDAEEGLQAFLDKRPPVWKNK